MVTTAVPPPADHLTQEQLPILQQLKKLLAHRQDNLEWRHRFGSRVVAFQEAGGKTRGWFLDLTEKLGVSDSNLRKHSEFARFFSLREAEQLDRKGCTWGMVTLVLHVP